VKGVDEKDTSSLDNHSVQHLVAGVKLLQLSMLELLIQERSMSPFELRLMQDVKLEWFPGNRVVSSVYWQYGMWMILLLMHVGALYFLLAKAAMRGYDWQVSFFRGALSEMILDILFIQVVEVLLLDYGLVVVMLSSQIQTSHRVFLNLILTRASRKHSRRYGDVASVAILRSVPLSQELSGLLNKYAYIPEATLVTAVIQDYGNHGRQNRKAKHHREESLAGWKQALLWWLNWLPKEMVQALVSLTAASSATLVLYVYLFVLLPVMSGNVAWLVLLVPCWV
jgi:hypothetical protein